MNHSSPFAVVGTQTSLVEHATTSAVQNPFAAGFKFSFRPTLNKPVVDSPNPFTFNGGMLIEPIVAAPTSGEVVADTPRCEATVDNGETGEKICYESNIKFFNLDESEWKDKGLAYIRILTRSEAPPSSEADCNRIEKGRVVIRNSQTKNVRLNASTSGMQLLAPDPRHVMFTSMDELKVPRSYLLRPVKGTTDAAATVVNIRTKLEALIPPTRTAE